MGHFSLGQADSPLQASGQSTPLPRAVDLLVIGGGIMGLWAAFKAGRLGVRTLLIDTVRPGAGASGGLLGALMAHMPDKWNEKKQFQLEALVTLEDEVRALEAETGLSCGYRRTGRLIPLPKAHLRPMAEARSAAADATWRLGDRAFSWGVRDRSPDAAWLSDATCAAGVVDDTLAARVSPRGLTDALVAAIDRSPTVQRVDGIAVRRLYPDMADLDTGHRIVFGRAIVAAGTGSFDLLTHLLSDRAPAPPRPLGSAVKGQAALLKADIDPALPVVFLNGLYLVAHDDGTVAIGSTSEDEFADPVSTDDKLDALIRRAREISPALHTAPVVERWAGLRPKAIDRDPMAGPHPDAPNVLALTGGFKVSFGIAHRLADAVLSDFGAPATTLPSTFTMMHHLKVASSAV